MAKSKLNFMRTTTDKLTVKSGMLSEDCLTITYTDENDVEQEVKVCDLLAAFKNQVIDFSIALNQMRNWKFLSLKNKKGCVCYNFL